MQFPDFQNYNPDNPESVRIGDHLEKTLAQVAGAQLRRGSVIGHPLGFVFRAQVGPDGQVGAVGEAASLARFHGSTFPITWEGQPAALLLGPADSANAAALRELVPCLKPTVLGLRKSFGFGDRLGCATRGHVQSLRRAGKGGRGTMAPVFAQQSMRENERTGRSQQQVVDEATWGVLDEGWSEGFGADADHLKHLTDLPACIAAGYTLFTVDPGDHVDNSAVSCGVKQLEAKFEALPWADLESSPGDLRTRLAGYAVSLDGRALSFDEESLLRTAVRYAGAVAQTSRMYRRLKELAGRPFELEVSVDETDTVTTPLDHLYIALELNRLGVSWVSLAPRFHGRFEKGVDYQPMPGETMAESIAVFRKSLEEHVAIARLCGPYKLSLHSGSDKFLVYPILSELAGEQVHVKTAGTSYLEALRTMALREPAFFREVVALGRERYGIDRASYHVSAELERAVQAQSLEDRELPTLLDDFHSRQILHVTYGSVLRDAELKAALFQALGQHSAVYEEVLQTHFLKHLQPFC